MQGQMYSNDFMRANSATQMPTSGLAPQYRPYGSHGTPSSANMMANQRFQPMPGYANPRNNATQANPMYHGQNALCANRDRNPMNPMTSSNPSNLSPHGANTMHTQRRTPSSHGQGYNTNSRHTQQREFSSIAHDYNSTGYGTSTANNGFSKSTNSNTTTQHTNTNLQRTNSSHIVSPPEKNVQFLDTSEGRLPDGRTGSHAINESRDIKGRTPPTRVGLPNQLGLKSAEAEIASLKAQVQALHAEKERHKTNSELVNKACHELQEKAKTLRAENDRLRLQGNHAVQNSTRDRIGLEQVTAENQELHRRLQVYESNVTAREAVRRGSQNEPIDIDAEVVHAPAILIPSSPLAGPAQSQPHLGPDRQATSQPEAQPQSQSQSDTSEERQQPATSPPKPPAPERRFHHGYPAMPMMLNDRPSIQTGGMSARRRKLKGSNFPDLRSEDLWKI